MTFTKIKKLKQFIEVFTKSDGWNFNLNWFCFDVLNFYVCTHMCVYINQV